MAVKNVTIKRKRDASNYDELYPKTTTAQVEGYAGDQASIYLAIEAAASSGSGVESVVVPTTSSTVTKEASTVLEPETGKTYAVKFDYGNTAVAPTLKFGNDGTSYPIRLNNTATNKATFSLTSGAVTLMYFDGSFFHVIGSQRHVKDIYFSSELPAEEDRHVNLILFDNN
jgi:hypothetical protein